MLLQSIRPAHPVCLGQRYRLHEQLGIGGSSIVHRATDLFTGEQVTAKILRTDLLAEQHAAACFQLQHEAAVLPTLSVSGIPQLRDYVQGYYLIKDFVDGYPLSTFLPQLSWREGCQIGLALCPLLRSAHARRIIVCDLSANNVLIDEEGRVFVIDFGIAHRLGTRRLFSLSNRGTPGYAAPELYGDSPYPLLEACDIYQLGVILWSACTRYDPARVAPSIETLLIGAIPERLRQLIKSMLLQDPRERVPLTEVEAHLRTLEARYGI